MIQSQVQVINNLFPQIATRMGNSVPAAINNAINNFLVVADASTPVDTGALRANKAITYATGGDDAFGEVAYLQHYSLYVHDGTYKMAARPWARDAMGVVEPGFIDDLARLGF